ncbi:restriction endonuclease subunit S [Thalassoroseus pseudoceratinae]|uniref:restriction endonuclease subunit S n=1 Tax=Thalassoroseus pseudoceratinae TaxID=2713176 RepID=UPI00141F6340|nr:restriction endonuclease subunit S [Thalassoroseus pseudoceratinae]
MSFPAYESYKPSGVPWIGDIPTRWRIQKLKSILKDRNEKNDPIKSENILSLTMDRGVIPYAERGGGGNKAKEDLTAYKLAYPNDIVLNSMNVVAGSVGLSEYFGIVSPVYYMLHPRYEQDEVRYFSHIFQATAFQKSLFGLGNGIMVKESETSGKLNTIRMRIPINKLNSVLLPYPNVSEQKAIASFLDVETAKIDGLVAEQRRLIELLKEKRQAVISHAVTKGLNPNAPMKPSGIPWLGVIPENWSVTRIKYLVQLDDGIQMGPFGGMLLDLDGKDTGYKVFGQENTISGDFTRGQRWISQDRYMELSRYAASVGDLVLTRKGSLGNARLIEVLPQPGIIDSDTIRIRVDENKIASHYLSKILHEAPYIVEQITQKKRGAILPGLNTGVIANLIIILPTRYEQDELIHQLNSESQRFDLLQAEAERAIDLLQERRTALISAAVTGKIDVREFETQETA